MPKRREKKLDVCVSIMTSFFYFLFSYSSGYFDLAWQGSTTIYYQIKDGAGLPSSTRSVTVVLERVLS